MMTYTILNVTYFSYIDLDSHVYNSISNVFWHQSGLMIAK